jgi:hypothetical protein
VAEGELSVREVGRGGGDETGRDEKTLACGRVGGGWTAELELGGRADDLTVAAAEDKKHNRSIGRVAGSQALV